MEFCKTFFVSVFDIKFISILLNNHYLAKGQHQQFLKKELVGQWLGPLLMRIHFARFYRLLLKEGNLLQVLKLQFQCNMKIALREKEPLSESCFYLCNLQVGMCRNKSSRSSCTSKTQIMFYVVHYTYYCIVHDTWCWQYRLYLGV